MARSVSINTKDVFLFILRQYKATQPHTVLQLAHRLGFAKEITDPHFFDNEFAGLNYLQQRDGACRRIADVVSQEKGEELTLERMLETIPLKQQELVRCLYACKGDSQKALDLYRKNDQNPRPGNAKAKRIPSEDNPLYEGRLRSYEGD